VLGADVAIDASAPGLEAAILEAAGGPADIVLEMVGGDTFNASLAVLAPFGRLVSYGMAGRHVPAPGDGVKLNFHSRGVLGFWFAHCMRRRELFAPPLQELLELVEAGELRTIIGGTYPLAQARRAHEELRGRRAVGKLVLGPAR
jgi:NADPH2:quinone reductase